MPMLTYWQRQQLGELGRRLARAKDFDAASAVAAELTALLLGSCQPEKNNFGNILPPAPIGQTQSVQSVDAPAVISAGGGQAPLWLRARRVLRLKGREVKQYEGEIYLDGYRSTSEIVIATARELAPEALA